jgi:hypothetical protein
MKKLLTRLRDAALSDPETVRFDVALPAMIGAAEDFFGFALPRLLTRSYQEIGNGGFGPGPLIGLPGGYESSWGDLLQTWTVMQGCEDEEYEEQWLPIIDWGCAEFSLIDCDNLAMVTLYEGEFHPEDYSFETLLSRWLDGELPELHSGGSYHRKR